MKGEGWLGLIRRPTRGGAGVRRFTKKLAEEYILHSGIQEKNILASFGICPRKRGAQWHLHSRGSVQWYLYSRGSVQWHPPSRTHSMAWPPHVPTHVPIQWHDPLKYPLSSMTYSPCSRIYSVVWPTHVPIEWHDPLTYPLSALIYINKHIGYSCTTFPTVAYT